MLRRDRKRWGLRECRVAWLFDVSVREYRELESGERDPDWETYRRISALFGWPESFAKLGNFRRTRVSEPAEARRQCRLVMS